ncbi:hypothetical protein NX07_13300, partial [Xanthomonas vasicola]
QTEVLLKIGGTSAVAIAVERDFLIVIDVVIGDGDVVHALFFISMPPSKEASPAPEHLVSEAEMVL